jgi:hypothetical protein
MSDNKYVAPPKPDEQVGGTHYSRLGIEPIQFIETNGLGYHEGNVIKYISRWRNKNGIEDLNKAKWYVERLIELEQSRLEHEAQVELPFDEDLLFGADEFKTYKEHVDEEVEAEITSAAELFTSPCGCNTCAGTRETPHTVKVSEQEQHLFDACSWFNVNKGLVAYPVYDAVGAPLGIRVCTDEDETTEYTYGECRWYASQYLKQNPRR